LEIGIPGDSYLNMHVDKQYVPRCW